MIFSVLSFIKGYLVIEVSGIFIERFINLCIKSNIYLWGISKKSKNCAEMKISVKGFFLIREAARKTGVRVKILKRCGFTMFLHKHRRRKGFYVGFVVFALLLVFLTSFIWTVEIEECERCSEDDIRQSLKKCGIYTGALRYGHGLHTIQDRMMKEIPELSWIWVEIKGTRAIVSVKEREPVPQIFDSSVAYNLVAKCDGVIESTEITNGNQVAGIGDVVKKGDLLVSGVYDTKYSGVKLLNSEGTVTAITWHSKKQTFPMERKTLDKTGIIKNKIILNVAGYNLQIFPPWKIKLETYEEEANQWQLKLWGDIYLPLAIKKSQLSETKERTIKMSEGEAFSFYKDKLSKEIDKELSKEALVLEKVAQHKVQGSSITVSVTFKCRENIAEKRPIQTGG